ncbi:glucose-1-phosphate thymidylyltransferase [archaeon SCG-AAA382B04]|nr:glucose-1-phosphate thymidylyltransferase [archaeon SCG-AAA382B04]
MDAVVLAGGFATRLWPITKKRAKPLLPLGSKKIVDYTLEPLEQEKRIDNIYLSTNKRFKHDFQKHIEERGYQKTEVVIEDSKKEEEKQGAIAALYQVIEQKNPNSSLLVAAGDNYVSFKIQDFIDYYQKNSSPLIAAYDVPRDEASQYGILELDGEKVTDFVEKPQKPPSTLAGIAYYIYTKEEIQLLNKYIEEGNNPDSPGYFIEWLLERQHLRAYKFSGEWFDIGTPKGYLRANKTILATKNILENTETTNSELKNVFATNSQIKESSLNNCIILENSKIKESNLKNVIVDGASIENQKVKDYQIIN